MPTPPAHTCTSPLQTLKQLGNWFTFVAAFRVLRALSPTPEIAISWFLLSRRIPYLLTFPLSGAAADHFNRGAILVASCALQAACNAGLVLVSERAHLK